MIAQNTAPAARPFDLPALLRRAWAFNPTLTLFTVMSALLLAVGVVGMIVDPRIVLGMPNWAKSTKFGISLALYGATLLWLLPMLTSRPRLAQFVAHATGAILTFEIVLLALQAVRGVPIHFNVSTTFDATLWYAMSASITLFWLVTALGLGLVLFQKLPNRVLAWSVRLGLLLTLIGFTEGYLMPLPKASQRAALDAGQKVDFIGAHTVGAPDGGPGLPLLGWSTQHGDLRIGHFVGIHGIQAIALLGALLLLRRPRWLHERHILALISIGAAAYAGVIALVTWQALRDQPLLAPDALTLGAAGALIAVTAALAGGVVLWARAQSTIR